MEQLQIVLDRIRVRRERSLVTYFKESAIQYVSADAGFVLKVPLLLRSRRRGSCGKVGSLAVSLEMNNAE